MKINFDKTLLKYSFYIVLTATALYILYGIIGNTGIILETIFNFLGNVLSVLSPFIIALVITYLLHPMVKWIELNLFKQAKMKQQLKRTLSVLLTYLLIVGAFILFIYSTYLMIGGQFTNNVNVNNMIDSIMKYSQRYNDIFQSALAKLETSGLSTDIKDQFANVIERLNGLVGTAINTAFDSIKQLGSNLLNILLGVIIGFYILKDLEYFKKFTNECCDVVFNKRRNKQTKSFLDDVDNVVSKFIRGQLLDGLIVGILSSLGLWIIGLDFPVLIGMTAGIFNIIPYFGPLIGTVPAVIVGLLSGSPIKALFAVLVLLLVQQLDGAIIAPKVVGESVGIHPVFVILSIIIGGALFGLLGMLLAVPTAGIIKLLIMRWRESKVEE